MTMTTYSQIGKPLGRAEGPAKVTGATLYPADVKLPGMLIGKCLRSPFPHARIISIDTGQAQLVPGVHAVLTAADLPSSLVGRALRDFPPLARDVVLFAGQKVAAVAADTREIADEALSLIDVEYEELPGIFDVLEARAPSAPVLHPQFDTYEGRSDFEKQSPNDVAHMRWNHGDVEAGFAAADLVIEHTFRTQRQHQGYLEPHACVVVAETDDDGAPRVRAWVNSKAPFQLRTQIAEGLELKDTDVTIEPSAIGGDFGGKGGFMDTHVAYWLAKASARPVRMTMDYTEELIAGNPRHGAVMTFKTGVNRDGTMVARSANLLYDSGAFGAFRPQVGTSYGARALGPYRMEHGRIDSALVYTNLVPCGSMRSPGDPQSIFASEAHLDLVAREIGIDPLAFRLKNVVQNGDASPLGKVWRTPVARKLLETAGVESGYRAPRRKVPGKKIGIGFSLCERGTGAGPCTVKVSISREGQVGLNISLRDTGSGFYTMLPQVVGEILGVSYTDVALETWSTDAIATDGGVGGARVTNTAGNAVLEASEMVKDALCESLTSTLGWVRDDIQFRDGQVAHGNQVMTLAEVMDLHGDALSVEHTHVAPVLTDDTVFTVQAAEVEIDEETGAIEVTKMTSVHDVATVLNPLSHQGQIEGALVQALGYTLMEEVVYEDGYVMNAHLGDYKLPTMRDIPELNTVLVRSEHDGPTPFGGKGIGEHAISGVAPAVVNAILDATGESFRELPVSAEAIYRRLHNKE
ncbi:MAG: CO/xanthine dehydrogenase Mo-binding subunit [Gammaproteobacteria bacterium]|jgi:CO/xanthine dehydrogenase Mo-binding subunit